MKYRNSFGALGLLAILVVLLCYCFACQSGYIDPPIITEIAIRTIPETTLGTTEIFARIQTLEVDAQTSTCRSMDRLAVAEIPADMFL